VRVKLHVWRQSGPNAKGAMESHDMDGLSPDMSFLEMLDIVNERLIEKDEEPIAFEHDCREGICGCCGLVINGTPHGPHKGITTCQLHMRSFQDGDEIWIEPWRSTAFPVIKDLVVDRSSMDRIIQAGGYISANTGSPQDANALPIKKEAADKSLDAAACVGCGACVAACPNASAMLFVAAKLGHLGTLPQGQPERYIRVTSMLQTMDGEGFGNCSNHGACQNACPKEISVDFIARLNMDLLKSTLRGDEAD
jgi:succinate dehydrogenase / fumarate reductase iron-sulfur subunit